MIWTAEKVLAHHENKVSDTDWSGTHDFLVCSLVPAVHSNCSKSWSESWKKSIDYKIYAMNPTQIVPAVPFTPLASYSIQYAWTTIAKRMENAKKMTEHLGNFIHVDTITPSSDAPSYSEVVNIEWLCWAQKAWGALYIYIFIFLYDWTPFADFEQACAWKLKSRPQLHPNQQPADNQQWSMRRPIAGALITILENPHETNWQLQKNWSPISTRVHLAFNVQITLSWKCIVMYSWFPITL